MPVSDFESAVDRLGLQGQPRALVFHEKEGRRHAHCVWSRIDAETMTARPLSFFKTRLVGISRDLYLEHGWTMPRGIEQAGQRNPTNFTLAEWQQAKRQGEDPRWRKDTLQACWSRSDGGPAFVRALQDHGFFVARGDRRGHVVVDHSGEVHSLARMLGLKAKEIRARLGEGVYLPGVAQTTRMIGERMTPAIRRHGAESRERFLAKSGKLGARKEAMGQVQPMERTALDERLTPEGRDEAKARAARLPKGLSGLWHRLTGQYQAMRKEAERTRLRHEQERQALIDRQRAERGVLQAEFKSLRKAQAERLLTLRQEIGRFLAFSRGTEPAHGAERDSARGHDVRQGRDRTIGLKLEP